MTCRRSSSKGRCVHCSCLILNCRCTFQCLHSDTAPETRGLLCGLFPECACVCAHVCVGAIACPSNLCITSVKTTGTVLAQAKCASRDSAPPVCVRLLPFVLLLFFHAVLVQCLARNFDDDVRSVVKYYNPVTCVYRHLRFQKKKNTSCLFRERWKSEGPAFYKSRLLEHAL